MDYLGHNLQKTRANIAKLNPPHAVTKQVACIAVSKGVAANKIRHLYQIGQKQFAENYAREFQQKHTELADLDIEWHFIGHLQSNKTKIIAEHAHWLHSLTNTKQAKRLNEQRPTTMGKLNTLIEVNLSSDKNKHGLYTLEEVIKLANSIQEYDNLSWRGLMGVASQSEDNELVTQQFLRLETMFEHLNKLGYGLDTLSMGMSNDYETAIMCGATMVRIGSNIFGPRL